MSAANYQLRVLDSLDDSDAALGRELVAEYVEATFLESAANGAPVPRELSRELFPEAYDFAAVYGAPRHAFVVAEAGRHAAGGVGIKPLDEARCEMKRMWVRPQHRRDGIGRSLVSEALAVAAQLGYASMVLDVVPHRIGAISLYRSMGFVDTDPTHDYPFAMTFMERPLR